MVSLLGRKKRKIARISARKTRFSIDNSGTARPMEKCNEIQWCAPFARASLRLARARSRFQDGGAGVEGRTIERRRGSPRSEECHNREYERERGGGTMSMLTREDSRSLVNVVAAVVVIGDRAL